MKSARAKALVATIGLTAVSLMLLGNRNAEIKVGDKAPDFSAKGTDGKTHSLKSLMEKGPVVLYFIKIGCPVNHRAAPHFEKIADAYKGKATMIGVINGNDAEAKKWLADYKSDLTLVTDGDLKIIRSYGAEYSPWAVAVENGKIAAILEGGSPKELAEVNVRMAKAAKIEPAKLSYPGAPAGGG